jgi:acylglycerol lipase
MVVAARAATFRYCNETLNARKPRRAVVTLPTKKSFQSSNGLKIAFRQWDAQQPAKAIVAIVPGFNAHSGYYQWVADQLTTHGISVVAVDLRGRGESEGERFFVESFDDYVEDVANLVKTARSTGDGVPIFLFGHSAGGVVACLYALDHKAELAGLICESFAHELPAPDVALAIIRGLSHLLPHQRTLQLKNADFSRDAAVVTRMDEDPLIANESQPMQTLAALVRADQRLKRDFAQLTMPLLILHGTEDRAAKTSGSVHFYEQAGAADKTLKLYDGSFHDPLNDIDRDVVMADVLGWIAPHLDAAS